MKLKFDREGPENCDWYERINLDIPTGSDSMLFISELRAWFKKWVFK